MSARAMSPYGLDTDYPLLSERAREFDFAERLGGCSDPVMAEIDAAMRELWDARRTRYELQSVRQPATRLSDPPGAGRETTGAGSRPAPSCSPGREEVERDVAIAQERMERGLCGRCGVRPPEPSGVCAVCRTAPPSPFKRPRRPAVPWTAGHEELVEAGEVDGD